jgi:hypothetical protein
LRARSIAGCRASRKSPGRAFRGRLWDSDLRPQSLPEPGLYRAPIRRALSIRRATNTPGSS